MTLVTDFQKMPSNVSANHCPFSVHIRYLEAKRFFSLLEFFGSCAQNTGCSRRLSRFHRPYAYLLFVIKLAQLASFENKNYFEF